MLFAAFAIFAFTIGRQREGLEGLEGGAEVGIREWRSLALRAL